MCALHGNMTENGKHLGIHALKIRKPIVDRDLGNDQSEPPREVLVFISEQSETRAAAHHFLPYAVKFYAYIFVANVSAVVIVARYSAIRLCGEPGLWAAVRLRGDYFRAVGIWAENAVMPIKTKAKCLQDGGSRSSTKSLGPPERFTSEKIVTVARDIWPDPNLINADFENCRKREEEAILFTRKFCGNRRRLLRQS